ncbi:hypothetical protein F4781DRAFT_423579 [Annulohypoxylon bovei var. microspora]|nr:hypothetical protein F4781DRAFT_423579 [Annulohypoxylon bovei var. microspora]
MTIVPSELGGGVGLAKTTNPDRTEGRPAIYPRETNVKDYPKGMLEFIYTAILGDPDRKWGPFYKHVRAARKEGRWEEWSTSDIVNAEPNDAGNFIDPDEDSRLNKHKPSTSRYRLIEELRDDVRPAHIDVEEILQRKVHPGDYGDDFYKHHCESLYKDTAAFVNKWFDVDVNLTYLTESDQGPNQIWSMLLSEQFTEYSRLVVREDQRLGGWPIILNDNVQRKWLIVGIMSQIMEKKIFNELLFGADHPIQAELERLDSRWVEKEGYGRKAARAVTARYGLEGRLLPRNFWNEVDELAAKTVQIFLPLLNVLKEVAPTRVQPGYMQEAFLQDVHALLSYAGLIQVCMAVSPSIFHFLSATPGARMDYGIEKQSDMRLYRESKEFYEDQDKHWREYVDAAMSGRPAQNRTGVPIRVPLNKEERNTMEYHRIRGAKVKFAVFPKVTRYQPINPGKGTPELVGYDEETTWDYMKSEAEGQDIVDLTDCMVIYSQGLIYPEDGLIEATSLDEHMDSLVRPYNGLVAMFWTVLKALLFALRVSFWHILAVSIFLLVLYSFFMGWDVFRYVIFHWFPMVVFLGFCIYNIAMHLITKGNIYSPWLAVAAPIVLMYFLGFWYMGDEAGTLPVFARRKTV